jgi:hypothetical protein
MALSVFSLNLCVFIAFVFKPLPSYVVPNISTVSEIVFSHNDPVCSEF